MVLRVEWRSDIAYYTTINRRLCDGCATVVRRLYDGCTTVLRRLYNCRDINNTIFIRPTKIFIEGQDSILSIIDNVIIDREARANVIDNTTRAKNEGFDVDVCFLANYEKFDLDLFIADADAVVESFIIRIMSFEMLVIRYSLSVFSIANINIWRRCRLIENL